AAHDGDLGARARLAGHALDGDDAIGDLRHLQLEQPPDEARMGARDDDLRAFGGISYFQDVDLDAVVEAVGFGLHLFLRRQDGVQLADIDGDVAPFAALHRAGDDLADALVEIIEDLAALRLADTLHHDLLGGLRGDAPEIIQGDIEGDDLADQRIRVVLTRLLQRDLGLVVL